MITNERQYKITRANAEKFKAAIDGFDVAEREKAGIHPTFIEAELSGLNSQLVDLEEEIRAYEELQSMQAPIIRVERIEDLAEGLIAARIASGLSQRELAERMGLKPQQIQRYESDKYSSASLARIVQVTEALNIELRNEILVPYQPDGFEGVLQKLSQVGLDAAFLRSKLLSSADESRFSALSDGSPQEAPTVVDRSIEAVSRVYGWAKDQLFSAHPLSVPAIAGAQARFKMPAKRDADQTALYATYANYLARLVLNATPVIEGPAVPDEPEEFLRLFHEHYEEFGFRNLLNFSWDLGIPVVPLRDGGQFHGACWRISGRNVIVMKQKTPHVSRWIFDLLHELYHASQRPEETDFVILETAETSEERRSSDEEVRASQFAGEVGLSGQAEELTAIVVDRSRGDIRRVKSVVARLAEERGVDVGLLANYLAFRLQMQGISWWGAAANLQRDGEDPWMIARDVFCERFSFAGIDDVDGSILQRALERN